MSDGVLCLVLVVMLPQVSVPALPGHIKDCKRQAAETEREVTIVLDCYISHYTCLYMNNKYARLCVKLYLELLNFSMLKPMVGTISCAGVCI